MSSSKAIGIVCAIAGVLALALTIVFMNGESFGIVAIDRYIGYENRIFDDDTVHEISVNFTDEDWESFIKNALQKEYYSANVTIDGETFENVGVRTKGNSTLSTINSSGSHRFSLTVEFDHYDKNINYYGLDKLILNNMTMDGSFMRDYVSYHIFNELDVPAPLSSFAHITINGEDIGLYVALEGIEDGFLKRTVRTTPDLCKVYKPDNTGNRRGQTGDQRNLGSSVDVKLQYIDDDPASYPVMFGTGAKSDITDEDKARMISALKTLNSFENVDTAIDVDELCRYWACCAFINCIDSYIGTTPHNYYLLEEGGSLRMVPWDYDSAFGNTGQYDASTYVNAPIDNPVLPDCNNFGNNSTDYAGTQWITDLPMVGFVFMNDEYKELYHSYLQELIDTVDTDAIVLEAYELIAPYVAADQTSSKKDNFASEAQDVGRYCQLRKESIQGQLDGTIPSTVNGQEADPDSLIDCSDLEGSSVGGSGAGGMGGMGGGIMSLFSFGR